MEKFVVFQNKNNEKFFSRTFSNQNFRQQFSWEEEKRGLEPSWSEIRSKLDQKSDPP
jgi:hypothetical protein